MLMRVNTPITICSVCGGETWRRYGARYDSEAHVVVEFADCVTCGASYLYKRPARPEEVQH
jgi:hypothetical protein